MKLSLALVLSLLMPLAAMAADGDPAAAGTAWLSKVDAGYYGASWSQSSSLFQSHVSSAEWTTKVTTARAPLGAVMTRGAPKVTLKEKMPGAPDGHYAVLRFQTKFANKADAIEFLILMQEGKIWKTAGYYIR